MVFGLGRTQSPHTHLYANINPFDRTLIAVLLSDSASISQGQPGLRLRQHNRSSQGRGTIMVSYPRFHPIRVHTQDGRGEQSKSFPVHCASRGRVCHVSFHFASTAARDSGPTLAAIPTLPGKDPGGRRRRALLSKEMPKFPLSSFEGEGEEYV